jgi:hypothetical protein
MKRKKIVSKYRSRIPGREWGVYRQSDGLLVSVAKTFIGAQSQKRSFGGSPGDYFVLDFYIS